MKTNEDVRRLYELSVLASYDTMDDSSRLGVQVEVKDLLSSIQQTTETVQFNTHNLLGSGSRLVKIKKLNFQIGSSSNESMTIELVDLTTGKLGLSNA